MRKPLFITAILSFFAVCQLIAQEQPYMHGLLSQPRGSVIKTNTATQLGTNPVEDGFSGQSGTGANIDVVLPPR